MKIILENKEQWEFEKSNFGKHFNIPFFRIAGIEPVKFPCILIAHPSRDVGGYSIICDFLTKEDIQMLNKFDLFKRIREEIPKKS